MGWSGRRGAADLISVIVPAHNEAAVIGRCLEAMLAGSSPGELEVIVACNGCSDSTADIARAQGPPVRVVESARASKTLALNLADASASGFPRIYMDADVVMDLGSLRALAAALEDGGALAAAPVPVIAFHPKTSWLVRAYYRAWLSLPYVREGMVTAGVYALSRLGRARFEAFPDVMNDDGFVWLLFSPAERVEVAAARSIVYAPTNLRDLLRIRTRARLGTMELRRLHPDHFARHAASRRYARALAGLLARPALYLPAVVYGLVAIASVLQARIRARDLRGYVWARDDSSRVVPAVEE